MSAEYSVWIESITQTSGRSRSSVAQTASSSVSARISTASVPPSRAARSFTWAVDSSPVTSSARRPAAEIAPSALSRSVDLPTPGSPPTSTRLAGTSPPPRTRSSSGTPVEIRFASSALTSTRRSSGLAAARRGRGGGRLLDERAERVTAGALAEPAPGGVTALGTRVVDCRLGHLVEASPRGGRGCANSVPEVCRVRREAAASRSPTTASLRAASRFRPERGSRGCTRSSSRSEGPTRRACRRSGRRRDDRDDRWRELNSRA